VQEHPVELDRAANAALAGPNYETHNIALILVLNPVSCGMEAGRALSADSGKVAGEGGSGGMLCVGNAHLFWDPAYPTVKLLQARAVTVEIKRCDPRARSAAPAPPR
jgi:hypothetical protein